MGCVIHSTTRCSNFPPGECAQWGGHQLSTLVRHRGSHLWHGPQLLYDDSCQGFAASGLKCNTYELGAHTALVSYAIYLVQCGMVPAFS